MNRHDVIACCETHVLPRAAALFGTSTNSLCKFKDSEGCANLVYQYERDGQPRILRISYRPDRTVEHIQAGLRYKIRCIEDDIPYLGFFDRVFSPENPFAL